MRYAIFSDIHSNAEAFSQVVVWLNEQTVDKLLFLGDIVGYGAEPNKVISILQEMEVISLAGNHDWTAVGRFDVSYFNLYAKEAMIWTQQQLDGKEKKLIESWPLTYEEEDFITVHGSLWDPEEFNYILNPQDALLNFKIMNKKICFVGHSHRQEVYILNQSKLFYSNDDRIVINQEYKYIVNVGSVGQPRDRDNRASVCIYDSQENMLEFYRIKYDIKKTADKIIQAGLPSILAERLYSGY